jgi:hypothetical protein
MSYSNEKRVLILWAKSDSHLRQRLDYEFDCKIKKTGAFKKHGRFRYWLVCYFARSCGLATKIGNRVIAADKNSVTNVFVHCHDGMRNDRLQRNSRKSVAIFQQNLKFGIFCYLI